MDGDVDVFDFGAFASGFGCVPNYEDTGLGGPPVS
jgi:hypothetical protein